MVVSRVLGQQASQTCPHSHEDTFLTSITMVRNRLQILALTHSCCVAFLVHNAFSVMGPVLVPFLIAVIKHSDKKQLKEGKEFQGIVYHARQGMAAGT